MWRPVTGAKNVKMDVNRSYKTKAGARNDNRRMTGNINIYICSEPVENAEESDGSDISPPAKDSHGKSDKADKEKCLKPSKVLASCRRPLLDESDLWLHKAMKRQNEEPQDKSSKECEETRAGDTSDNKNSNHKKDPDPRCTCCCSNLSSKRASNSPRTNRRRQIRRNDDCKIKSSGKKSNKNKAKKMSKCKDERSFFSKLIGAVYSKKADVEKKPECSPSCTALKKCAKADACKARRKSNRHRAKSGGKAANVKSAIDIIDDDRRKRRERIRSKKCTCRRGDNNLRCTCGNEDNENNKPAERCSICFHLKIECVCRRKLAGDGQCTCKRKNLSLYFGKNGRLVEAKKPRGADNLPYQRSIAFSKVIEEIQQKSSERVK